MQYTDLTISRLHEELKDITREIIRVCDRLGIRYFIVGGTAMGAFFFEDILPWDDDLDIGMRMDDYLRFIELAPSELRAEYFMQVFETEPDTPFYFMKIRRRDSVFLEELYRDMDICHGIYVDIFPFNRVPRSHLREVIQRTAVRFLVNCFMAKSVWVWKPLSQGDSSAKLPKSLAGCLAVMLFSYLLPKRTIYALLRRELCRYDGSDGEYLNIIRMPKDHILADSIDNAVEVRLGDLSVRCPRDLETYLRSHYGDIRKYPEPDKMVNHAPVELVFPER